MDGTIFLAIAMSGYGMESDLEQRRRPVSRITW
jgi:hypothetical protein